MITRKVPLMTITNSTRGQPTVHNGTTETARTDIGKTTPDRGDRRNMESVPAPVSTPRDTFVEDVHAGAIRESSEDSLVVFHSILSYFQEDFKAGDGRTDLRNVDSRRKAVEGLADLFSRMKADGNSLTSDRFLGALQLVFNPTTVAVGGKSDMMMFLTDLEGALRQIEKSTS